MPIVVRCETNMFRLLPLYPRSILVNLTNCVGAMGAGLALEFKNRYPGNFDTYHMAHLNDELAIGKLVLHQETDDLLIVNMPTKRHWIDASQLPDVILGLEALREVILQHPHHQVLSACPGTGLGGLMIKVVYPELVRILNDLPNVIHICMAPEKMKRRPRYLSIIGPRDFDDEKYIELAIMDATASWGTGIKDFDGFITSDDRCVDTIGARMAKLFGLRTCVVRADWEHYPETAGILRNPIIADVATHVLAFTNAKSIGTEHIISLVKKWNANPNSPYQKQLVVDDITSRMKVL